MAGLLHDATEAYLVDIPTPVKRSGIMHEYLKAEKALEEVVSKRFFLEAVYKEPCIKEADMCALATEARDLMGNPQDWVMLKDIQPDTHTINPLSPKEAKHLFMRTYVNLDDRLKEQRRV